MATTAGQGPGHEGTIEITIPSGSNVPVAGVYLQGLQLVGVIFPAVWTAAAMTWDVSMDGVNYYQLDTTATAEYSTTVVAGVAIPLNANDFKPWRYIAPRSGTHAVGVNQLQNSLIQLCVGIV